MLLSLFALNPPCKFAAFPRLYSAIIGFPKPPVKRGREGVGSPVLYPSSNLQAPGSPSAPQRGKAISTLLGPKPRPGGVGRCLTHLWFPAESRRLATVPPGRALPARDPEAPWPGGEEDGTKLQRWGALSNAGSGEAYHPGLTGKDRGNGHVMGPGTRGCRYVVISEWHVCDRAVQTPGEGRLPRTGNPTKARPERRGRGSQWSGHRDPAATACEDSCSRRVVDLTSLPDLAEREPANNRGALGEPEAAVPAPYLARPWRGARPALAKVWGSSGGWEGDTDWPPDGRATRKPQPIPVETVLVLRCRVQALAAAGLVQGIAAAAAGVGAAPRRARRPAPGGRSPRRACDSSSASCNPMPRWHKRSIWNTRFFFLVSSSSGFCLR